MRTAGVLIRNLDVVFPVKITSSHRICLDPGVSLDDFEKRQPLGSTGIRRPFCQDRSLTTMLNLYCVLYIGIAFNIPIFLEDVSVAAQFDQI
jgi:hypothetical protein